MNATRRPRVLLLCERLDIAGGVERFICNLAQHLNQQGMDVAVGSVATPRTGLHFPLSPEVRVLHGERGLPEGDGLVALLRKQWRIGRVLGDLIRTERPDAVVLNGLTTACSVLLLAPGCGPLCICCDHNHFDARSSLWRWLRERLYRRVAAVVSLTQVDAARFRAINPRTEVIYNASSLSARVPALPAAPLVLAVGRLVEQKGLDLLLRAWVDVQARMPMARLRILGNGPLQDALQREALERGIADSVQWLPPTPQVADHYRAAAVFVLPSRYEGMPLALLEAQALGVPCVAFDCPTGPAEIIDNSTGILVPAGDVRALGSALLQLLADAPMRSRMGHAAIARSADRFSPQQHLLRWAALVRRVATSHRAVA